MQDGMPASFLQTVGMATEFPPDSWYGYQSNLFFASGTMLPDRPHPMQWC